MTAPTPYLHFPGTARDALNFYGEVFGCAVQLHTFDEFNRSDGPADAIAHGYLDAGPVALFAADVTGDEAPFGGSRPPAPGGPTLNTRSQPRRRRGAGLQSVRPASA